MQALEIGDFGLVAGPDQCVESGADQIAFIMNATKLSEVVAASEANEVLPRKSSFFYPKPVSGLVAYEMEAPG